MELASLIFCQTTTGGKLSTLVRMSTINHLLITINSVTTE
jgi:hypothetical protein